MRKYSFLVFYRETQTFVDQLMDLGVLHVIAKGEVDDEKARQLATDIREANLVLANFKKRSKRKEVPKSLERNMPTISVISDMERRVETLQHQRDVLLTETKMMEPWGQFSWDVVKKLDKKTALDIRFFRHPKRTFEKEWKDCKNLVVINESSAYVYFIVFSPDLESLPSVPLALPKQSLNELKESLSRCEQEMSAINDELDDYASRYTAKLENLVALATDELNIHMANAHAQVDCADKLTILEGWCPVDRESELIHFLKKNNHVFVCTEPAPEDLPPVVLKNNRFAKLFEPIGNLFSLPHHSELDLTVFFAPFFLLFFGFCLGDAGYGLVMLTAATLLKFKVKADYKPYLTLLQLFGVSTAVIGYFSGTLFGLEMAKEPAFASLKGMFLNQDQLFKLALYIGFSQIIFGLGVNVYKQVIFNGWLFAISKIGWIILLISLGDLYVVEWASTVTQITVWIGAALIIGFGAPEKGWLKSIGFGLADLYNITGVAGDLLSYIRLFALGVSSAILGLVVNSIALSAKDIPYVGIVLFVLMLVVGHGANLLLASLSAFVHPMRLTFVEFYKNAGFLGGGKPYQPLARKAKEKL